VNAATLPRRAAIKLGAALVGLGLLGGARQPVSAQTPAPAQIPRSPEPPAATAPPGSTTPPGGATSPPTGATTPPPAATTSPSSGASVEGTWLWLRTEYSNDATVAATDPSKYVLGLLPEGRLTLQADCNRGSGSYTLAGAQIAIRPGPLTLAACPPGSQDAVFLRDLRQVATYVRDGENLVLNLQVDGGNMVFSPQPAASLTGAPWRVQSVNNGRGGVASVIQGTSLSITFGEDGTASGETGCNAFRGPYTVTAGTLSFGALATTRRACLADAANAQEQAFLDALAASTRFELSGGRLTLRNDGGATQVILSR
jgi:heat shock protein HslJ